MSSWDNPKDKAIFRAQVLDALTRVHNARHREEQKKANQDWTNLYRMIQQVLPDADTFLQKVWDEWQAKVQPGIKKDQHVPLYGKWSR